MIARRTTPSREMQDAVVRYIAADPAMTIAALESDRDGQAIALRIVSGWSPDVLDAQIPGVLDPLERALLLSEKPDYRERRILETLIRHAEKEPAVTRLYLALMNARSRTVRDLAGAGLASRPEHIPLLIELLSSSEAAERKFAVDAFRHIRRGMRSPDALDGLWPLLHSEDGELVGLAARVLIEFASYPVQLDRRSEEDLEAFARAAAGLLGDEKIRETALMRLGSLGEHALPWLDQILAQLGDEGLSQVKVRASLALRQIAGSGDRARNAVIPRILPLLSGENAVAAAGAAHVLAIYEEHDEPVLGRLPELIRNPRKTVHFTAVSAAQAMGERALPLVPLLLEVAEDPPGGSHVDSWAIEGLSRIVPEDERVLRIALAGLLDAEAPGLHPLHGHVLRRGGESAARLVADALADADSSGRLLLLSVLSGLGSKAGGVVDKVRPLTKDADPRVARTAAELVKRLDPR